MRTNKRLARDGDTSSYVTFVGMLVDQVTTFRKCTTEMQLREAFFGDDGENWERKATEVQGKWVI